jgi:hypothetical protein
MSDENQQHPFAKPVGSDAECFIQWKGTDLCMDLHCPCGVHSHIDSEFVYAVRCPGCGAVYEMGTQVILKRDDNHGGTIRDAVDDDNLTWNDRQSRAATEN